MSSTFQDSHTKHENQSELRPTICHVLHSLQVGGGEVLAKSFALEHQDAFRPVFALLDELGNLGRELKDAGFAVEVLHRRPGFDRQCARALKEFFHREHVRLIHAHQYAPLFYSALARWPKRDPPILFTEHGRDYPDYRRWKRVWANRMLLTKRDRIVAVGDGVREALVDNEGIPAKRVEVIHNGRDLSKYDPQRSRMAAARSELGLTDSEFVIIMVARLNRLKDHPTALQAMKLLIQDAPHARLILVGDGEDRDHLEAIVRDLKLENIVRFLGSRDDVPYLLQAADLFLLSSISEGIPLTLIEAMATGLPCVSTDVGGVREVLVDGESGCLCAPSDPDALCQQIAQLIHDSPRRKAMGLSGLARVNTLFDDRIMHQRYRHIYMELLDVVAAP